VVLADVLDLMAQIIERPIKRHHIGRAMGDARHTAADVTKARQILGYNPIVGLEAGLTREWEWIRTLYC
jgi:UDP-glucose 4-epimerase